MVKPRMVTHLSYVKNVELTGLFKLDNTQMDCQNYASDAARDIRNLIKCRRTLIDNMIIIIPKPLKGVLFITKDNPGFISGQIRVRGKSGGQYPYKLLHAMDYVFGFEPNTIEVCSGKVTGMIDGTTTVDINPKNNPAILDDAEILSRVPSEVYNRWRSDPPYNHNTAANMYNTGLPSPIRLLKAGARVCKPGSLLFLLLGPVNHQHHPEELKRIGCIMLTVVPNNELRCLNIYYKL